MKQNFLHIIYMVTFDRMSNAEAQITIYIKWNVFQLNTNISL